MTRVIFVGILRTTHAEVIMLKDVVIISGLTVGVICGAVTGIVGGAMGIAGVATAIHLLMHT